MLDNCTCHSSKTTDSEDWEKSWEVFAEWFVLVGRVASMLAAPMDAEGTERRIKDCIRETRTAAYESGFYEGTKNEFQNQVGHMKEARASALREALEVVKYARTAQDQVGSFFDGYMCMKEQVQKRIERLLDT